MLDKVNSERHEHMITIEDPIEYLHGHKKCVVNQREVHAGHALLPPMRCAPALREDPDVVLIGEMRGPGDDESALRIAETGHLTFATLHTNSTSSTINRIVDVFPAHQQSKVACPALACVGRDPVPITSPAGQRNGAVLGAGDHGPEPRHPQPDPRGQIHQIYASMQAGQRSRGLQTFNQCLASLYFQKQITLQTAVGISSNPEELQDMINRGAGLSTAQSGSRPAMRADGALTRLARRREPCRRSRGRARRGTAKRSRVSGSQTAKPPSEAALRREQVAVTSVREKGKDVALPKAGGRVPAKALAVFTRQFSVMIDAGLPLVQCLEILGTQQDHKGFARVLQQTRMDVEAGASLADAMRKHPKTFDDTV